MESTDSLSIQWVKYQPSFDKYIVFQSIGEFILTHPNMKCKEKGSIYSLNEGYAKTWSKGLTEYIRTRKDPEPGKKAMGQRYVGSMVADVHRTILNGGIFIYPPTASAPTGKLRLLYECNPMAYIIEQAGGVATTGKQRILDIQPTKVSFNPIKYSDFLWKFQML